MQVANGERPKHGGDLHLARCRFGREIVDFSANINPLGPPPGVWTALQQALPEIVHYPSPTAAPLREALAAYLKVDPRNLALGNGSIELIYLLPRLFPLEPVTVPAPGFSEYEYAARLAGRTCRRLYLRPPAFQWEASEILAAAAGGGLLFLCSPNNPTGTLLQPPLLDRLLEVLPATALLVMDEAFLEFLEDFATLTLIYRAVQDRRLLVLGSLTKFFALPGLRLGYVCGHAALIDQINRQLPPWNINSLAQAAGLAALADSDFPARSRKYLKVAGEEFYQALQDIPGLEPLPPTANFIFCHLGPPWPAAGPLLEALGQRGFLARNCANYPGLDDRYLRLAVRRREENQALLTALRDLSHALS